MTAVLDYGALSAFSLNALRLRESSFSDTVSRISSGLRMTTAGDDVAAWMMGVRLDNRARGWTEASQNIQNGISLLATADAGVVSIGAALERIRELAVASANGVYQDDHRAMIQNEVDALRAQIYATVETTEFNGLKPLAGNSLFTPPAFVFGLNPPLAGSNPAAGPSTQSGSYDVTITKLARAAWTRGIGQASPILAFESPTVLTVATDLGSVNVTLTSADAVTDWPAIINAATTAAGIGATAEITNNATTYPGMSVAVDGPAALVDPAGDGLLFFRTTGVGGASTLAVSSDKVFSATGYGTTAALGAGTDFEGTIGDADGTAAFTATGLTITAGPGSGGADGLTFTINTQPVGLGAAGTVTVTTFPPVPQDFTHVVQFAPDYLDEHVLTIETFTQGDLENDPTDPMTLGGISLATQADALAAISVIDAAIQQVNEARTKIGSQMEALEGELTSAINGAYALDSTVGRITDADMAVEATELMQGQLAQQTGLAVLEALHAQSAASLKFMVNMLDASPLQAAA